MNNSTVERKENVCRERRLLFGDQKSFPRTGFQAFWKFQLRVPSKRKQGPMHHPNLMYFGRNSSSSKVVDFYQETSRKADKTNPSQRGNEELCWKRHGWDALPLSPVGVQKSVGTAWGRTQHRCFSCQKPQWDQREPSRGEKNTHGSIICNCLLLQRGPEHLSDFKTF